MSRLYDALKNAQATFPKQSAPGARRQALSEDGPMLRLCQAIDNRLADRPRPIVQVMGCGPAEDAAAVARRLAQFAAVAFGRRVLLLDATVRPFAGRIPGETAAERLPLPAALGPVRPEPGDMPPFALGTLAGETCGTTAPQALRDTWSRLRTTYDMVVVESAPVSAPLGLTLAPTVDGVLLVVEADRTRAAAAMAARDALIGGGANILGVILDKRRYWIPQWLWDLV